VTARGSIAAVWLGLFLLFNLNLRAIESRDTRVAEYTAFSLAARGDADLDEFPDLVAAGLARGYVTRTPDGHVFSNYPIASAAVAAPAYWLALRVGAIDAAQPSPVRIEAVGKLTASALVAGACALLMAWFRQRGGPPDRPRNALAIVLTIACATPLWSSASQALWTHAPAALALAAALLWLDARSSIGAAAAGVGYGLAAACRPLLAVFLIGAAIDLIRARDRRALPLAAGAIAALGLAAGYNLATFGGLAGGQAMLESADVHRQTHAVEAVWSRVPLGGLPGIVASPSRGVFIFCPVLVIAAIGAWRRRQDRSVVLRVTLPSMLFVAAWAEYAVWWGGHSFGPRYVSDIAIPAGVLMVHGWDVSRARIWTRARTAIVGWSILVQLVGVFCYPGGAWNALPRDVDRAHERLWDWRDSQIPRTVRAGLYRRHPAR
jgi:hypothetical protein